MKPRGHGCIILIVLFIWRRRERRLKIKLNRNYSLTGPSSHQWCLWRMAMKVTCCWCYELYTAHNINSRSPYEYSKNKIASAPLSQMIVSDCEIKQHHLETQRATNYRRAQQPLLQEYARAIQYTVCAVVAVTHIFVSWEHEWPKYF